MKKLGLLALLSASIAVTGCGTRAQTAEYFGKAEPPAGQQLRYISGSEPESLDPQVSTGQPEARVYLALSYLDSGRARDAKVLLDEVNAAMPGHYDAPEERRAKTMAAGVMPELYAKLK